jgi:YesN/AraC family two-component response regulator
MWLIIAIISITIFSAVIFMQKKKIEWANQSLVGQNIEAVKSEQKIKELETQTEAAPLTTPLEDNKYSKSALLEDQKEDLLARLNHLMDIEKAYTKKDLTVVIVAKKLGTNKSYVSQVINESKGVNFSSYVNEYRVKEARRLLTDKQYHHLKIESIAGDAGFNSVSAFNNAFKKFTGLTPSFYLKSIMGR